MMSSVGFLLRRTTTEAAYVAVPVTDDVMTGGKLDEDKLRASAIELGWAPECAWTVEKVHSLDLHPTQKPSPKEDPK
jgi:hypothetical protein